MNDSPKATSICLPFFLAAIWCLTAMLVLFAAVPCLADGDPDPAYLKIVTERAAKIVVPLRIDDAEKSVRVRDIIAYQYVDLSRIHETRDAAIEKARGEGSDDKQAVEALITVARNQADANIYRLHAAFLAKLSVELNPEQIEGVKDGITYGVARNTYNVYLKMMPDLSEAQKRQVLAWLIEARELAMDQGSSDEKHKVFGKYKGKINNYLSAAGYNLKEAEKNLRN